MVKLDIYVMSQVRLGEFSLHLMKIVFMACKSLWPALSQNRPTTLVVWSFGSQSTAPSLRSSLGMAMKALH
jgi:hypothetical protein